MKEENEYRVANLTIDSGNSQRRYCRCLSFSSPCSDFAERQMKRSCNYQMCLSVVCHSITTDDMRNCDDAHKSSSAFGTTLRMNAVDDSVCNWLLWDRDEKDRGASVGSKDGNDASNKRPLWVRSGKQTTYKRHQCCAAVGKKLLARE